jgi:signal transduction histidine kinase
VRVPGSDRLLLAQRGAPLPRGQRAGSVPVSARLEVVAARPAGTVDSDVRTVWLTVFAAALSTLATVALIAWGAAPLVVRGRIAVRERSEALRVLANVRDGVFLTDADGVVRFWNRAAEAITGLSRPDVWGRRLGELPGLGSIAREIPVGEEGNVHPETLPVQLGLSELWLSMAGVETPEGTVYTFADSTEEQRLEQLKNDFVSTVSHELRTPLTGVYGAAETLRERGDLIPPTVRAQLIATVGDQAQLLARVIEDILLASGIESDQLLFTEKSFEGVGLAREAVEEARLRHSTTRVQLVRDEDALLVNADPVRTRQVLDNLIDNAVNYSDRGPIWVAVESGEGITVFSVADEGPGIAAEKHERIFEKFYRSDVQMQGGVGGAGLGLYISRELVRRMGGRLWVESAPGAGSLFSFELPALSE